MRRPFPEVLEKLRVHTGPYASEPGSMFGAFEIPMQRSQVTLRIIATNGKGEEPRWEHVSVSTESRCPTWDEMCFVKELFWKDEETVLQIHPAKSKYVNIHPYTLHLWRRPDRAFVLPPEIMV